MGRAKQGPEAGQKRARCGAPGADSAPAEACNARKDGQVVLKEFFAGTERVGAVLAEHLEADGTEQRGPHE